jgi:DNA polymerase-3 subunit epsilon
MTDTEIAKPLSKTALKELRLKPAPNQKPVQVVVSRRTGAEIRLYDQSQCVPMRPARPATPAQLEALERGRMLRDTKPCGYKLDDGSSCEVLVSKRFGGPCHECDFRVRKISVRRSIAAAGDQVGTIYLDLETTGFEPEMGAEVLEVSIINDAGEVLLNSLVKPSKCTEWPEAQAINGISPADVASAPAFADLLPEIQKIVDEHDALVIYNRAFDLKFLPKEFRKKSHCAMVIYAEFMGWADDRPGRGPYKWHKLIDAAAFSGHPWSETAHRALADAQALRTVWHYMRESV